MIPDAGSPANRAGPKILLQASREKVVAESGYFNLGKRLDCSACQAR